MASGSASPAPNEDQQGTLAKILEPLVKAKKWLVQAIKDKWLLLPPQVRELLETVWKFLKQIWGLLKDLWVLFGDLQMDIIGWKITDLPKKYYTLYIKSKIKWEPPKQDKCSRCDKDGKEEGGLVFCVDCKPGLIYCRFCACLTHHPTMKKFEQHSLEEIKKGDREGVKVISPILPDMLILGFFVFTLLVLRTLNTDNILGASYCPTVNRLRKWTIYWDPNAFYYFKDRFAEFCNVEDSFWRIHIDLVIRSIYAGTDSYLLLFISSTKAYMFATFIEWILSPIAGYMYGILGQTVHIIEQNMPQDYEWLEKYTSRFQILSKFGKYFKASKAPPLTERRRRPMQNYYEGFIYLKNRQMRMFTYYKDYAQVVMTSLVWASFRFTIVVRFLCIAVDLDDFIRGVLNRIGLAENLHQYRTRFSQMTGVQEASHVAYWSDWFTMNTASLAYRAVSPEAKQALQVSTGLLAGARATMWPIFRVAFIPLAIFIGVYIQWKKLIKKQNKQFAEDWGSVRAQIFGACNRDNLVAWRDVKFNRQFGDR